MVGFDIVSMSTFPTCRANAAKERMEVQTNFTFAACSFIPAISSKTFRLFTAIHAYAAGNIVLRSTTGARIWALYYIYNAPNPRSGLFVY